MRTLAAALLLAVLAAPAALAGPVPPSGCPTCIQNTATPQQAQINIGTATIRGTITASTLTVTNLHITTFSAAFLLGDGAGVTDLNASQLLAGTVPAGRLAGSYTGITGLGTIAAGTWQGTAVGTQWGGTGQNWSAVGPGALPYFSGTGILGTLAPGTANYVLQANGAGAPSWTGAPTIAGSNVTGIPLANLQTGNLPSAIKATDASLVSVSGSKVSGDIGGNAENINGTLALGQLGSGTLAADIVAQTLNNIGTPVGTFGGPTVSAQVTTDATGRVTNVVQFPIPAISTSAAWTDRFNDWHYPQTSRSSWTFLNDVGLTGNLSVGGNVTLGTWHGSLVGTQYGGTGENWSAVAAGNLPYFGSLGDLDTLPPGTTGYTLTMQGGLPVWAAAASSATALAGGAAGQIPYQAAPNTTAFLPQMGNGGLVIGTGGQPSTGTLAGTANQVLVANGPGTITLSLPQSIGTGNAPTFAGLTLSSPLTVPNGGTGTTSLTAHGVLLGEGAGAVAALPAMGAAGVVLGSGTSADPSTGTITGTANRVTVTQTTAGLVLSGPQDLATNSGPTFGSLTLTTALGVASGGTGAATLTAHGLLYGAGTSAVSALAEAANGQLAIGSTGNAPVLATLTGTANRVTVTNGAGSITLSGPQDIGTASSPSFASLSLTNALTPANGGTGLQSLTAHGIPVGEGTSNVVVLPAMGAGGILVGNGTSVDPSTATLQGTANQVVVTQTAGAVTLSLPQSINTGASPTFAGLTLSSPLTVANGGTGQATLTAHGLVVGEGTGGVAVMPAMGAAGLILGSSTGADPSTGTLTGTANRVTVTQNAGGLVLSGPQDLGTGSSPTFAALSLTAALTPANGGTGLQSLTAHGIPVGEGTSNVVVLPAMGAGGILVGNGTSVDPSTAALLGTSNQVTVTQSATAITLSLPQNINSGASPTFSALTLNGTGNSSYDLTLSTSITFAQSVTGIGIRWADGTVSTTAASGGTVGALTAAGSPTAGWSSEWQSAVALSTGPFWITSSSASLPNSDFSVRGGTFATSGGAYSAPSQPCGTFRVASAGTGQNTNSGTETSLFFNTTVRSAGGIYLNPVSSGTFIVPPGQGGNYIVSCGVRWTASGLQYIFIKWNGNAEAADVRTSAASTLNAMSISEVFPMAAGDTISCQVFQNSGSAVSTQAGGTINSTYLSMCKLN